MDMTFNNIHALIDFLKFCFRLYFSEEPTIEEDTEDNEIYIKNDGAISGTHLIITKDLSRIYIAVEHSDFIDNKEEYSVDNFIDLMRLLCKGNGYHLRTKCISYGKEETEINTALIYSND